jgi:hypothetical protein
MIAQNFPEKVNFPGILSIPNHHPEYFTAMELKDPRPVLPDNGKPEEKPKHAHTTAWRDKKLWPPLRSVV